MERVIKVVMLSYWEISSPPLYIAYAHHPVLSLSPPLPLPTHVYVYMQEIIWPIALPSLGHGGMRAG